MHDNRLDELVKKEENKFLLTLMDKSIFVIAPNVEKYQNDANKIDGVSKQLLIDVLSHDDSYEYVKKLYNDEIYSLTVYFITEEAKYISQLNLDKKKIVKAFKSFESELYGELLERYKYCLDIVSFDNYYDKHKSDIYSVTIDGKKYNVRVGNIIDFLNLSDDEYDEVIKNNELLWGIPKEQFLYSVIKFFEEKNINSNYLLDEKIGERLSSISSSEQVDIEALNEINGIYDDKFDMFEVNEGLKKYLLSNIPEELNNLEKAIYVYIKMCKCLSYDEQFFAVNQGGPLRQIHENPNHVSEITLDNNEVVCYEFNAIYEKILAELGLNLEVDDSGLLNSFGGGHASLRFRYGKYLVYADSTTSILNGDLVQAKLNNPLVGLKCVNKNLKTKEEFSDILSKVYKLAAERERKLTQNNAEEVESFEYIVGQYSSITDNIREIPLKEKMDILVKKVNSINIEVMDRMGYILNLRKVLFNKEERENDFKVSILRDNGINNTNEYASVSAIFALNIPNDEDNKEFKYYFYTPGKELIPIEKERVNELFNSNTLQYIQSKDPKLPGITGGMKK